MDSQERAGLIRKGNELFNQGKINEAMKLFVQTNYGDGIMRIADHYYYDKKRHEEAIVVWERASEKMDHFLEDAKAVTDLVVIDCSPFIVADAAILASKVDAVLWVVRIGHTRRRWPIAHARVAMEVVVEQR